MSFKKTTVALSEIYKRVPQNQLKQFEAFSKRYENYSRLMNKYPEKLPVIKWHDYKSQVRAEAIKLLEDFEKKYEELNQVFDSRHGLDHTRYFVELEKEKKEVQKDIVKFKAESEARIRELEKELTRLENLKPYNEMTMEEFCILQPEKAKYVPHNGNTDLFWPFNPQEQLGYVEEAPVIKPTPGDSTEKKKGESKESKETQETKTKKKESEKDKMEEKKAEESKSTEKKTLSDPEKKDTEKDKDPKK